MISGGRLAVAPLRAATSVSSLAWAGEGTSVSGMLLEEGGCKTGGAGGLGRCRESGKATWGNEAFPFLLGSASLPLPLGLPLPPLGDLVLRDLGEPGGLGGIAHDCVDCHPWFLQGVAAVGGAVYCPPILSPHCPQNLAFLDVYCWQVQHQLVSLMLTLVAESRRRARSGSFDELWWPASTVIACSTAALSPTPLETKVRSSVLDRVLALRRRRCELLSLKERPPAVSMKSSKSVELVDQKKRTKADDVPHAQRQPLARIVGWLSKQQQPKPEGEHEEEVVDQQGGERRLTCDKNCGPVATRGLRPSYRSRLEP